MSSSPPRQRFQIELRDIADDDDAPLVIRLRHFLKSALRAWGLKCTKAVELLDDKTPDQPEKEEEHHGKEEGEV
jgi:hypothetical protein